MNTRFFNARILTMENDFSVIEGELWVEQTKIRYVGKETGSCDITWNREIDCHGNLLMPGFKNAHTHSAMTFLRSYADDLPLLDWLNKKVFPMESQLKDEDVRPLVILAVMEYLTSGITSAFDMYFLNHYIPEVIKDLGYRMVFCGSINDFCGSLESLEEEYLRFNQISDRISYQLGFHAEYTTGFNKLKQIAALGEKYKAPVYTHNSESLLEVDGCIERYGVTPTVFLESLGMFEYGGGGFHCVHMSKEDLLILKKHNMSVITNPASNAKLASGIISLTDMAGMGINLAIGTDGPASNNCLDMFREMYLTTVLQKLRLNDASAMDANQVLYMATVGGAKAMGLPDCDTLTKGKNADLILIDLNQPNMQPINNLTKNIVYSGSKQNVKLTMVNGKILYEDGKFFIGEDPETIYKQVNQVIKRIKGKNK